MTAHVTRTVESVERARTRAQAASNPISALGRRVALPRVVLLALAGCLVGAPAAWAQPGLPALSSFTPGADVAAVPGDVVVRFRRGVDAETRARIRRATATELDAPLPLAGLELVRVRRGRSVHETVAALERDPRILYAEPNSLYRTAAVPNDPLFGRLWGLHESADADIDAPEAWDLTTGRTDVVVGVVDTGVAYDHPDLAANLWTNPGETGGGKQTNGVDDDRNGLVDDWRGWDWVQSDNAPLDFSGHGTHVAGTIGARGNDGVGVAGVNWRVGLMPLRAGDASGAFAVADVVRAFAYASANGARVVNASFGGPTYSQAIFDTIAAAPSTLFVVAAGNGGGDGLGDNNDVFPTYPCSYPASNVVCVAAVDRTGRLAAFSNHGSTSVDLAAPGTAILSSVPAYERVFADGFENDLGARWVAGASTGNAAWARTDEARAAGGWSVADSPGVPYVNNADTWIASGAPLSLDGRVGCGLDYALRLATEPDRDGLLVEAAAGGAWRTIAGWTGSTGGAFLPLTEDLTALDGRASVSLRFRLTSDAAGVDEGAHVDDVAVRCLSTAFGPADYEESDGTSMATPHVAGVAALVWAYRPDATVAEVRDALLRGVDRLSSLAGVTASGGRLNAFTSLRLLAAPPPPPDRTPPTNPTVSSPTHTVAVWSAVRSIEVSFAGANDSGSGVDGFSYAWTTSPTSTPDTAKDAEESAGGTRSPALADGDSWYFHIRTKDYAGNWSEPEHTGPFQVDATAPAGAVVGGAAFAAPFQLRANLPVSWGGTDALSGVDAYDVTVRKTSYRAYSAVDEPWLTDTTTTDGIFPGAPGYTYCFTARGGDRAGNESLGSPEACTAVPLGSGAFVHGPGWKRRGGSGSYLGRYSAATRRGARLSLRGVQGRRLALVATRCPRCGTVRVSWGPGTSRRIRLASRSVRHEAIPVVLFDAVRTVDVVVTVASSRRSVRIEGFGISRH